MGGGVRSAAQHGCSRDHHRDTGSKQGRLLELFSLLRWCAVGRGGAFEFFDVDVVEEQGGEGDEVD